MTNYIVQFICSSSFECPLIAHSRQLKIFYSSCEAAVIIADGPNKLYE